jgi:hypothetical protein
VFYSHLRRRAFGFIWERDLKVDPVYPPLDVLKPVTESVWVVDSGPITVMGVIPLPVRMTILRLQDGSLILHSPTRFNSALHRSIENIGAIKYLVAPNTAHWMFVKRWQEHCPAVQTWAAPGVAKRAPVRRAGVRLDHELCSDVPVPWSAEIDQVLIEGVGFAEVAFLHKPSKSIVLTDLAQNLEVGKLPALLRPAARMIGVVEPNARAPIYLRAIIRMKRKQASAAARQLVSFQPDFVIFSHGQWYSERATERLTQSLRWLLD